MLDQSNILTRDLLLRKELVKETHQPLTGLFIFSDGHKCSHSPEQCAYMTRSIKKMREHYHKEHKWVNPYGNGGRYPKDKKNFPWRTNVYCQKLSARGPNSKLFEIALPQISEVTSKTDSIYPAGWLSRKETELAKSQAKLAELNNTELASIQSIETNEYNRWLKRMGWAKYLENQDRTTLLNLIKKACPVDEPVLFKICNHFTQIITVAVDTTMTRIAGFTRMEINRTDKFKDPQKPLNAWLEESTIQRYQQIWLQIICFIFRTFKTQGSQDLSRIELLSEIHCPITEPLEQTIVKRSSRILQPTQTVSLRESSSDDNSDDVSSIYQQSDAGSSYSDTEDTSAFSDQSFKPTKTAPQYQLQEKTRAKLLELIALLNNGTAIDQELRGKQVGSIQNTAVGLGEQVGSIQTDDNCGSIQPVCPRASDSADSNELLVSGRLSKVNRVLLELCVSLLDHKLGGIAGVEYNNPLIAAMAVLGVHENGGWVSPLDYTPKISAVIKLARIMVVQHAWEMVQDMPEQNCFSIVQDLVDRFMTSHNPTPMRFLIESRRYGLKIRDETTVPGSVNWIGDRICYQDIEFGRMDFQRLIHGLVNRAWQVLSDEVFLLNNETAEQQQLPKIPWEHLRDIPAETQPRWSFLDNRRNQWPVKEDWMFNRIWNSPNLQSQFVDLNQTEVPWRRIRVEQWLRAIVRFKEMLLILMHFTGGQPARAPELLSIRYCNTANGGRRNIFIENGLIVFVTEYHKGYQHLDTIKIIHRYLPQEVGELLVYYLWLILPLQHMFEARVLDIDKLQPFLFSSKADVDGKKWTPDRMKRILIRESQVGMGERLTIASYRHICIAMSRRYLGRDVFKDEDWLSQSEEDEDEDGCIFDIDDDILDIQAGHSSRVAGTIYARNISEAPGSVDSLRQKFRQASQQWHRFLRFPSVLGSSSEWGRIPSKRQHNNENEWEVEDRKQQMRRWKEMQDVNIFNELRLLMGENAKFREPQEMIIKSIMNGEKRILGIMGTGYGKSLTFLLPAAYNGAGTTIVIVPLLALRADMKKRCDDLQILCAEWDFNRPPEQASIVLVTPESAVSKGFSQYINRLRGMHKLDRIVIDECHVILDCSDTFRPKIMQLKRFFQLGCQVIMLTATLPPQEQEQFLQRLGIDQVKVDCFRIRTLRKNISYQVQAYDGLDSTIIQLAQNYQADLSDNYGKIIIYTRTRARAEELAAALDCEAFHAGISESRKTQVLNQLCNSSRQVVVATSALGLGVDIPNIRLVLHVGPPDLLRSYAQESGRAGRDGQASRAIILVETNQLYMHQHSQSLKPAATGIKPPTQSASTGGGFQEMRALIAAKHCRRIILDQYLDGYEQRVECEDGEEACDICLSNRKREAAQMITAMEQARQSKQDEAILAAIKEHEWERQLIERNMRQMIATEALQSEQIIYCLEQWRGKCPVCYVKGMAISETWHTLDVCGLEEAVSIRFETRHMKQTIKYAKYSCCFECGVPQAICRTWTQTMNGGWKRIRGETCQFGDILHGAVVTMMIKGDERIAKSVIQWMEQEGVPREDTMARIAWFGNKHRTGGIEMNQLTRVFCSMTRAMISP